MKFKRIIGSFLLASFLVLNISPSFAIAEKLGGLFKKEKKQEVSKLDYINLAWWEEYQDEHLENYILKAIENNHDVKLATLKVEQARQNVKAQFASELPSLTVGASPAINKMPGSTSTEGMFMIPMIASWEVDIFLKNRDKTKSIKKMYEASVLSEKATYIGIASAVGATYYNIVRADELIALQEEIVADRKQIYELTKLRNEEGISSTSDLVEAEKGYILADSDLSELKKIQHNLLTSLALLVGDSPENIENYKRISYKDLKIQKEIPQLTSEVITARPDYLIAEKMVEKAGLDVRVAKKEFLPSFNLGGVLALMTSGHSMNWESALAGAGIIGLLPVFTGGARIANLKIFKNKYEQVLTEYQKTNLTAIKEVNDSISDLKYDIEKYEKAVNALKMEETDFAFSQNKYNEGVISYLNLLEKKEALLSTKKLAVSANIDSYIKQISLYKATAANL